MESDFLVTLFLSQDFDYFPFFQTPGITSGATQSILGYGFDLDASADASAVKLKELIKTELRVSCPAASISLYTTKGGTWGGWLQTKSEEYELLKQLKVPASVKEMLIPENELDPLSFVGDDAYGFPDKYESGDPVTFISSSSYPGTGQERLTSIWFVVLRVRITICYRNALDGTRRSTSEIRFSSQMKAIREPNCLGYLKVIALVLGDGQLLRTTAVTFPDRLRTSSNRFASS
ncbi:hypothetical protein PHYSODRAFT_304502 [Phytophthora sojae]|uniref:Uncharacterized protein n=1 Tax=Phytophthora sojae (strain P6497) TaxID=1094619 RepID=G5A1C0_PHYSP|nr:hypothetical protein PHYSODRAFT_304502 [Phytophthora sojae]EGZ10719.1 hypothetical protein PHYSODRAFT_304502 [Phytophthora sojae]|eukprot:XP_009533464.1 hypothetical protein PHYSODRAFT_304502 [Phytophthora sojae]